MMVMDNKTEEKVTEASEKYSLSFIKNAAFNTIKKEPLKGDKKNSSEASKKKSSFYNW